jgi:hypothetical protein
MFEYAVRPFESRDVLGRTILPSTPGDSVERATLTWGSSASTTPGTLPKPTSLGVNIKCCQEIRTQDNAESSAISVQVQGHHPILIPVKRSDVVLAKKQDENHCDDWLMQNSSVASGVSQAFSDLGLSIHASDNAFRPAGSNPECRETTKYKYDGAQNAV